MLFVAFFLVPKEEWWSRWCRTREQDNQGARNDGGRVGGGNLSSAASDIPGARASVDESSMQTASMRLAIGRQHFGGSIEDFEEDTSDRDSETSDHSNEDEDVALLNQPPAFFAP